MGKFSFLVMGAASLIALPAYAEESKHKFKAGLQMDLGVPDGLAAGITVKPFINFARFNLAGSYNGLAPGLRGGVTFDPIKLLIAPTLTFEYGKTWYGKPPVIEDVPKIGYEYVNTHLGLEIGNRDSFRIFLHAGPSWVWADTQGFAAVVNPSDKSLQVGELSGIARINPCAKIGFVSFF